MFSHVDTFTGGHQEICIHSIGISAVISILVGNVTTAGLLRTAITDIRSFVDPCAAFLFEVGTGLVTGGTGRTLDTADQDLLTGIGLFTVETVDTKVLGIHERALVEVIAEPVSPNLLRDRSRVFTEPLGDYLKGHAIIKCDLNKDTVVFG